MDNYNIFLSQFNAINKYLITKYKLRDKTTFGEAIYLTKKKDPIISYYFEDLKFFSDLRNVLIHGTIYKQEQIALANPSDEVIKRIQLISERLKNPKTVGQLFKKKVICFNLNDSLATLLQTVKEKHYSQFPVFDDQRFVGIVTENGITNWLSEHVNHEAILLDKTSLKEVIDVEENKDDYQIILHNTSVFTAEQILVDHLYQNRGLALIISNKAKPSKVEDLLGIITAFDLPTLREKL